MNGTIFEVTADKEIVWQFNNAQHFHRESLHGAVETWSGDVAGIEEALGLTEPQQEDLAQLQTLAR